MNTITRPLLLSLVLLSSTAAAEPFQTATWVGTNYTPASCVNAVELWHDFRPEVIDRELAAAKEYFGLTTLQKKIQFQNTLKTLQPERYLILK